MITVKQLSFKTIARIESGDDTDNLTRMQRENKTMHLCAGKLIDRSIEEFNDCSCDLRRLIITPKLTDDGGDGVFLDGNTLTVRVSGVFEQSIFIDEAFISDLA